MNTDKPLVDGVMSIIRAATLVDMLPLTGHTSVKSAEIEYDA
jgi:hypothetical protein